MDDIFVPPPREAERWYCDKCGQPGAAPESGMLTIDPRYAYGYCDCTPGKRYKRKGYHRDLVNLIADFAWDGQAWAARQQHKAERAAFERTQSGMSKGEQDVKLAMKYRARLGLPVDD